MRMRAKIILKCIGLLLLCPQNCEAASKKTIFNSITFDDGTTVTEAVDFTDDLTKAVKSDAKLPNTLNQKSTKGQKAFNNRPQTAKERRGVSRITKMKECMAEVESMRNIYGQPSMERDIIDEDERLKTRLETFISVFYYLTDNDIGLFEALFKKYNYRPKYAKRLRYIYRWDNENISAVARDRGRDGTEDYYRLRKLYSKLVDDMIREALYENNAMSEYEVAAYKADRCKLMAVGKDPDLIKEHIANIASTINDLWNGFYYARVHELVRKGKLSKND